MKSTASKRTVPAPLSRQQQLWLLACAVLSAAPHTKHATPWLVAVCAAVYAWRYLVWVRNLPLPPRWLLAVLSVGCAGCVVVEYHNLLGRDSGTALLLLFIALKLMEMRRVRDGFVVVYLAYFLQLALFFYSQTLPTAVASLVITVAITATLIKLTHSTAPLSSATRLAGVMVMQSIPCMLLLFILFPRVQGPLWSTPIDAYRGTTGLSEDMSPGSIANLSLSDAIAFRVNFEGSPPPRMGLYWRGPVFSRFDGRTWHPLPAGTSDTLPYTPRGVRTAYSVTLEPNNKNWMFALELPAEVPHGAAISSDYRLLARTALSSRTRYDAVSVVADLAGVQESRRVLDAALQLPAGSNPRAYAVARSLRDRAKDGEELLQRMLSYFKAQRLVYTLQPPLLGEHSVDEFLFETKRGFCEHFASSFVFMMRAAGMPARVVTGYQGGELNPVDGFLVVRQSDAHAWAEVWIEGKGWRRVDPTAASAPSRIELGLVAAVPSDDPIPLFIRADMEWLRDLRFRWDALGNTWNQWVLGYNALRQREVLRRFGMRAPDWQTIAIALVAAVGTLMIVFTMWTLRRHAERDPIHHAWERFGSKLARGGLPRHPWEGPQDYAERIASSRPQLDGSVSEIAQLYIRLRYGTPREGECARRLVEKIKAFKVSP
jgi:transglutaminase-like putative cysteine protease